MARNPAPNVNPRDPVLGPLKGFFDWLHRRLDAELPTLLTGTLAGWNPPSVADGASTSTTVEVRGADFFNAEGDLVAMPVMVAITQALPDGCSLTGAVTAKGEVTVSLLNLSGGAVNLGAIAETRVCVWRYGS